MAYLTSFLDSLDIALEQRTELVISRQRGWPEAPPSTDPRAGMSPEFRTLVQELCPTMESWLTLSLELARALPEPHSEACQRLAPLSDRLWNQTLIGDWTLWHLAFPPLDGGGSAHAGAFCRFLKERFPGRRFSTAFEWCSGPGMIGFTALYEGLCEELVLADINPRIRPGLERTIEENGLGNRVRFYISDNLKAVPDKEQFDLILGNPPWAYRVVEGLPNPLIPNDPGWKIHRAFFAQIGAHIGPESVLCISTFEPEKTHVTFDDPTTYWDVRPRPPIVDFKQMFRAAGLILEEMVTCREFGAVHQAEATKLLLLAPDNSRAEEFPDPGLRGFGGSHSPPPAGVIPLRVPEGLAELAARVPEATTLCTLIMLRLEEQHLADLLKEIEDQSGPLSLELAAALGLQPGLVRAFPTRDSKEFDYQPEVEGFRLAADCCQAPATRFRLQLSQDDPVSFGLRLLRDLLVALPREIAFTLMVKPGFDESKARKILAELEGYEADRVAFWPHNHQTLFPQDNAKLGFTKQGERALWVPRRLSGHRPSDMLIEAPLPLVRSVLAWEGGNLLFDGYHGFIGVNCLAANIRELGLTAEQVLEVLQAETGVPFHPVGDLEMARQTTWRAERALVTPHVIEAGQADFHIDMDCCLLGKESPDGRPRAVVACPDWGFEFAQEVLEREDFFGEHFVSPERARTLFLESLSRSIARRRPLLDAYCRTFQKRGYEVTRVPDIRICSEYNYMARTTLTFNFANALVLKTEMGPTVALLRSGLSQMEETVERLYQNLGLHVLWVGNEVAGRELLGLRGGLHCACSRL